MCKWSKGEDGERQKESIIITREGETERERERIKARVKEKIREGGREKERDNNN